MDEFLFDEPQESVETLDSADKPDEIEGGTGIEAVDFGPILDYFNMGRPTLEESNQVRELFNWARGEGAKTRADILTKIKEVDLRVGAPPTGERKLKRLINYIHLDKEVSELMKERDAYVYNG